MRKVSNRIMAIGLPLAGVAASGAAVAYWTGGGSTTGSASTAAAAATLTVAQVGTLTNLAPGVAAKPISVTVTNNGTSAAYATQVVVTISSVTPVGAGSCSISDYALSGATTMTNGARDLAPTEFTTFSGASIAFNNTASNQDGCKGATVNLSYVAS